MIRQLPLLGSGQPLRRFYFFQEPAHALDFANRGGSISVQSGKLYYRNQVASRAQSL